ncbi:MAG TPA: polysaccharide ABC transporter ATP-binding protein [Pyrinomonadaceae bacterium]
MTTAIKVENVSKVYQIGQIGTGTISRDIERWFVTQVLKREDPFLKLGETNDRTKRSETNVVWSLRDINFDIEQGDAVGIIGRNGAGKSTLLKLLSRVTAPTTGSIKIKGRVASLLEVGTGFHPELTGRENVYLNGSILGMRKREIDRKLDEIIDFSGVERYIDTPVKRYSSGMSVRLAFAVAAHLESEILIVDEVLAVGDAEFQKKCLGKMEDVGKREGRTVLFVSHNMSAVQELCKKGMQIHNGEIVFFGDMMECINNYYHYDRRVRSSTSSKSQPILLEIPEINGSSTPTVRSGEKISVSVDLEVQEIDNPRIFCIIENALGQSVVHVSVHSESLGQPTLCGNYKVTIDLPALWLAPGFYSVYIKVLVRSPRRSARAHSDRVGLHIIGQIDATGKTLLAPPAEWELVNQDVPARLREVAKL